MARTNLPLSKFLANSATGLADPAGTNVDVANGMNIALASSAVPSAASADRLVIRFNQTFAGSKNLIIRAGGGVGAGNPPAFRQGLGDLKVPANAAVVWAGPFELARFVQTDGSINVDFDSGTTGTVTAFLLPKNTGN
jgi:hypothetical protein